MEKELGQINFTETDDGYRIDIQGKNLKEMFKMVVCCCPDGSKAEDCCPPGDKKKE